MDQKQQLKALHAFYTSISSQLSTELSKKLPDAMLVKDWRKQLVRLDKSIRSIQFTRDFK